MNKTIFIKLIFLVSILILWKVFYAQTCIIFILTAFVVISFLATSFAESSLLYRKSVANAVFLSSSWLFSWLQSKWFVLLKSILQAMFFGILLLIGSLQWGVSLTLIMGLDIILLVAIFFWLSNILTTHTKPDVRDIFARKVATFFNVLILTPILIAILFYSASPDFIDASLSKTLLSAQEKTYPIKCTLVSVFYSYDLVKEAFGWWAMMSASLSIGNNSLLFIGWSLFLFFETMYVWIFSKLILSVTIDLSTIFNKQIGDKNE